MSSVNSGGGPSVLLKAGPKVLDQPLERLRKVIKDPMQLPQKLFEMAISEDISEGKLEVKETVESTGAEGMQGEFVKHSS